MPDPISFSTSTSFGPASELSQLYARTDDELDVLPYGVICLDRAGTIVRYNLAEARFARLDRGQVVGKNFFTQIAPCTATPGFQGKFLDFIREGNTAPIERFAYIFDFRFGAQDIEAELSRSPSPDRIYISVNRKKFSPPRPQVPEHIKAPPLRELDPNAEKLGVLRDASERRSVVLSPTFFESLRATWDRATPETFPRMLDDWGFAWGRLSVVDLETEVLEANEKLLRELPMSAVMDILSRYLRRLGLGQLGVDFGPSRHGVFLLTLQRSVMAESSRSADRPRCDLYAGFFRAIFSHLANKRLAVREVRCKALGADACDFLVVSSAREAALQDAIARSERDPAAAVRHLSASPLTGA